MLYLFNACVVLEVLTAQIRMVKSSCFYSDATTDC